MSDSVRCPNCGALVAPDARWCGQCYSPLGQAAAPAQPARDDDNLVNLEAVADWSEVQPEEGPVAAAAGGPVSASVASGSGLSVSIRRVGEALLWDCPACETENPMEASMCSSCGTPFAQVLAAEERRERPMVEPGTALTRSLLLTGLGHMAVGRGADGIARLILFLWAAGLGAVMLLSPTNSGPIIGVGAVFVLAALGIWAVTALDAYRLASGDENQLLKPRILLVGTVALTMLSIGAFLAAPRV